MGINRFKNESDLDSNIGCFKEVNNHEEIVNGGRHGLGCCVEDTNTQTKPNANADEGGISYLDYRKTTETRNKFEIKRYNYKIVKSGKITEIYKYKNERAIKIESIKNKVKINNKDKFITNKMRKNNVGQDKYYYRTESTIYETKRRLRRLINANIGQYKETDKFITLTFKEFLTREEVIQSFKNFNKRLRYIYKDIEYGYIAIIEKGSQGTQRLHLHVIFFGLPYINVYESQKIWQYGTVDMKALIGNNDIASYVLKYVSKTLEDCKYIPKGKKFYITSMNLKRPVHSYLDEDEAKGFLNDNQEDIKLFETDFNSIHVGEFHYTKLKESKGIQVKTKS